MEKLNNNEDILFSVDCEENKAGIVEDNNSFSRDVVDRTSTSDSFLLSSQLDVTDVKLLDDEEFDFDLPLSPTVTETRSTESNEVSEVINVNTAVLNGDDDDEIFIGPVGYTEKCVAVAVEATARTALLMQRRETLTAAEMAELCKEAFTVASRIQLSVVTESPDSTENGAAISAESPIVANSASVVDIKLAVGEMDKANDAQLMNNMKDISSEKPVNCARILPTPEKLSHIKSIVGTMKGEQSSMPNPFMKKRKLEKERTNSASASSMELTSSVASAPKERYEPMIKRPCVNSGLLLSDTTNLEADKTVVPNNEGKTVHAVKRSLLPSHLPQAKKSRLLPPGSLSAAQKPATLSVSESTAPSGNRVSGSKESTSGIPTPNVRRTQSLLPISNSLNARPGECRLPRLQPSKIIVRQLRGEDIAASPGRLHNTPKAQGKENVFN